MSEITYLHAKSPPSPKVSQNRQLGFGRRNGLETQCIFAKSGYNGYMSAEYEGTEDAMVGVPKLIEKIKALCRKYSSTERQI